MLNPSTEEFRRSVCKDLNTTLEKIQDDVQNLREWIRTQPHLPQCSTNTLLTTFLVASKNRAERAKRRIDNYYTARGELPQFYADRDPLDNRLLEVSREVRLILLPQRTPDGCRVQMVSYATGDVSKYDLTVFAKRLAMQEDVKIHREAFDNGRYVVIDGANFTLAHTLQLTPKLCYNLLHCMQDVLPIRIRKLIFINSPKTIHVCLKLMKLFISNKIIQRIYVHTEGQEVLESYFPKKMLPKDYGGNERTTEILNEDWLKCLADNRDWLLNEGSMTVDESLRPPAPPGQQEQTTPTISQLNSTVNTQDID